MINMKKLAEALVELNLLDKVPRDPTWDKLVDAYTSSESLAIKHHDQPMYQSDLTPEVLEAYIKVGGPDEDAKTVEKFSGPQDIVDADGKKVKPVEVKEFNGDTEAFLGEDPEPGTFEPLITQMGSVTGPADVPYKRPEPTEDDKDSDKDDKDKKAKGNKAADDAKDPETNQTAVDGDGKTAPAKASEVKKADDKANTSSNTATNKGA